MGQVLKIDVLLDDHGALTHLKAIDAETNRVGQTALKAAPGMDSLARGMTAAGKTSVDSAKMIAGMSASSTKLTETTNQASVGVANLTGMLVRYVSGAAILGAVKATLEYASSLDKMRASTD